MEDLSIGYYIEIDIESNFKYHWSLFCFSYPLFNLHIMLIELNLTWPTRNENHYNQIEIPLSFLDLLYTIFDINLFCPNIFVLSRLLHLPFALHITNYVFYELQIPFIVNRRKEMSICKRVGSWNGNSKQIFHNGSYFNVNIHTTLSTTTTKKPTVLCTHSFIFQKRISIQCSKWDSIERFPYLPFAIHTILYVMIHKKNSTIQWQSKCS